jgi:hypothetical protein
MFLFVLIRVIRVKKKRTPAGVRQSKDMFNLHKISFNKRCSKNRWAQLMPQIIKEFQKQLKLNCP